MRRPLVAMCGVLLATGMACAQVPDAATPLAQDDNHLRDFRDKLIWKGPLVKTVFSALFDEAVNSPTEWGRGIDGFGKRVGNSFAQRGIKASVELAFSPLTHEDLHFHRLGEGSVWTRVKHVVVGTFWVPRDNGPGKTLAAGRITGVLAARQLSRLWMPPRVAGFGTTVRNSGGSLGVDVGLDLVREFWPRKK